MIGALVTGGAQRLGREMALGLAQDGYSVAVHYNGSAEAAHSVVAEIQALGGKAIAIQADLLDEAQIDNLYQNAVAALGSPINIVINNASIFEYDTIENATRESWDRHFMSNLRAPFVLTQKLAHNAPKPEMDANNEPLARAMVINLIDQRVRKLTPEFATYTLAKDALWTLTKTAAQGLAPRVRVNAIGPGPTLQGARQTLSHFEAQRAATILQRGANSGDIVHAMRYFLNAPAVTGQLLCVDGGQHLAWKTPDVLGVE